MFEPYDVIVVGGGHAGCEAAAASARLGSSVLLITMNLSGIAQMSCNPAIGGIAKGQIVREIDALGGWTGYVTDHTMVQFRMLNRSKGPAMWSPRAQSDRVLFSQKWQEVLKGIPGIHFWQDSVTGIVTEHGKLKGVRCLIGGDIYSKSVIITSGTFLNGLIHIGTKNFEGGRLGDPAAKNLTQCLNLVGIESDRLKTGTPVRIDGRTIDFSKLEEQKGDEVPGKFSFLNTPKLTRQLSCFLAYTDEKVHDVLRTGFDESPMFSGRIQGSGPRYCPSIEDKLERFSDRGRHQLFLEPEGWNCLEYYLNGFSSSLPEHVQFNALKLIPGFENSRIVKPGYAIEYDYFPPTQLDYNLESRKLENLFFAGQVNGTTGYEEAACQGLMAGVNAHLKINGLKPFVLKRSEAYIGVLIDDLVSKGTSEPYRMFTSRAEFRLLLRQDNADQRLTTRGFELGLVDPFRMQQYLKKKEEIDKLSNWIQGYPVLPDVINAYLEKSGTVSIAQKVKAGQLLLRPQVTLLGLAEVLPEVSQYMDENLSSDHCGEVMEVVEIQVKYSGYLEKERELAEKINRLEDLCIPLSVQYANIKGLSAEGLEKLSKVRPAPLGQASRISGISPSDISVLLVYLGR